MNAPTKPMTSTEKAHQLIDELSELEDQELAEALPIPAPVPLVRSTLAFIAPRIPDNAADLDQFLNDLAGFCLTLKSDEQPAPN